MRGCEQLQLYVCDRSDVAITARIKVPGGIGTWPASSMLGSDIDEVGWPACSEIDVMETVGSDPNTVPGTLHAPGYAGPGGGLGEAHRLGLTWRSVLLGRRTTRRP